MKLLKQLFQLFNSKPIEYQPVSQWLTQGENGWHNGKWSNR